MATLLHGPEGLAIGSRLVASVRGGQPLDGSSRARVVGRWTAGGHWGTVRYRMLPTGTDPDVEFVFEGEAAGPTAAQGARP